MPALVFCFIITKIHAVTGRILAVDIKWIRAQIRVIAVYVPHSGYDRFSEEDLLAFYEELYALLIDAIRKKMRIIIGGDFNTVFRDGRRGELLDALLTAFSLQIINDPEQLSFENAWTHTGPIGISVN